MLVFSTLGRPRRPVLAEAGVSTSAARAKRAYETAQACVLKVASACQFRCCWRLLQDTPLLMREPRGCQHLLSCVWRPGRLKGTAVGQRQPTNTLPSANHAGVVCNTITAHMKKFIHGRLRSVAWEASMWLV